VVVIQKKATADRSTSFARFARTNFGRDDDMVSRDDDRFYVDDFWNGRRGVPAVVRGAFNGAGCGAMLGKRLNRFRS
jgi:hypothetical protein